MTETQLSFVDTPLAQRHQRQKKETDRDVFLLQHLGPQGTKNWKAKNAKERKGIEQIGKMPLPSDLQDALNDVCAKIRAETIPLVDEYAMLGIQHNATKRDVKNAYRRQARKLHPDVGGDDETFKRMYAAYRRVLASVKE